MTTAPRGFAAGLAAGPGAGWRDLAAQVDEELRALGRDRPPLRAERAVAGRRVAFTAWSAEALARVVRPIQLLPPPIAEAPALEVRIGHGPAAILDAAWSDPDAAPGPPATRPRWLLGDGRELLGAAWPVAGMIGLLDRRASTADLWLREPSRLTTADAATLVRALLAWWLADGDHAIVHAAAVAGRRGAALLAGAGGTGKSSSAAAAFAAGLSFLGDDSVLCRASTAEVFSINTCSSLYRRDLERHHAGLEPDPDALPERDGKVTVDLARLAPDRVLERAPICAIVALVRSEDGPAEVRPAPHSRRLAALVAGSVFNVPAAPERTLTAVSALARAVPAFELALHGDRRAAGEALRRFLDGEAEIR